MTELIKGVALDGTEFTAESPEVVAYRAEFPDVELEAAIGSVVDVYNNNLPTAEVSEVTE